MTPEDMQKIIETSHKDIRGLLELGKEFGLRRIKLEHFEAEFGSSRHAEMPGTTPEEETGCPCGHPPEEHGEAGCLRGCDPAKCEANP